MKSNHTKGQWKVLFGQYPIGTLSINEVGTNKRICALEFEDYKAKDETEDNAVHIVKCVNAHEELIMALTDLLNQFERVVDPKYTLDDMLIHQAKTVLYKVRDNTTTEV